MSINNVFKGNELDEKSNVRFLHVANSDKQPFKIPDGLFWVVSSVKTAQKYPF